MEIGAGDSSQFSVNSTFMGLSCRLQKDLAEEMFFEVDSRYGFYESVLILLFLWVL